MPTTFVTLCFKEQKKYIFSLPGNPVSAGVCTHLFLLPFLRTLSGRKSIMHSFKAKVILYFTHFTLACFFFFYICS